MELRSFALILLFASSCVMLCLGAEQATGYMIMSDASKGKSMPAKDDNDSPSRIAGTSTQPSQGHMLRSLRERSKRVDSATGSGADSSTSAQASQRTWRGNFQKRLAVEKDTAIPDAQVVDKVTTLPGQPPVPFAQYAGYVTTNETAGRALFYYFVEAESSPEEKPLILWLNGGPGCSSLGYGAFEELGPFRVKSDGATLIRNHYAWNKFTNVLFLESPAGVGYSYSNDTNDYTHVGDAITAADNLNFLLGWIERFPQYKYRDFYITGESYAGNYVPQLTQKLYEYNKQLAKPFYNLKGFLVGNAIIDADNDLRGTFDYFWHHAIISDETYFKLQACEANLDSDRPSNSCLTTEDEAYLEQGNIDPYDIYTPKCLTPTTNLKRHHNIRTFKGYDPCVDNYVSAYLNTPAVQEALHANLTHVSFPWSPCSDLVNENYGPGEPTVIPIYKQLIAAGLKIWVMSGDVDSVVPVTATRYSLRLLKLKVTVPWYPWYLNQQVGGFTEGYEGLTFVTVRNSGHEIPLFQPARGLALFKAYITNTSLPRS